MPTLVISGKKFSYTIIPKLVGSLSLRIKSRRTFVVTSPRLIPSFVIHKFISDHQSWILKNSQKFSKKIILRKLSALTVLDETYEILVSKTTRDSVVIFKNEHKIYVNSSSLLNSHLQKLFDTKFRPMALSLITSELRDLTKLYPFSYHHVSVKNTTSRFGSCSSTNNLNFNWQIIFFPKNIFPVLIN